MLGSLGLTNNTRPPFRSCLEMINNVCLCHVRMVVTKGKDCHPVMESKISMFIACWLTSLGHPWMALALASHDWGRFKANFLCKFSDLHELNVVEIFSESESS